MTAAVKRPSPPVESSRAARVSEWLVRQRFWLLALGVVLTLATLALPTVDYDQSMESMFSADDPALVAYGQLKRAFGGNEVVLVVYTDPGYWQQSSESVERMRSAVRRAAAVPGVQAVLSIDQLRQLGGGEAADADWVGRLQKLFTGYTHGADGQTLALVCQLDPHADLPRLRGPAVEALSQLAAELPEGVVTGEPVMVVEGFRQIRRDARRLAWGTVFLLGLTIWWCFGTVRWVIVPLIVVQFALLMTRALLVLCGIQLTMVSSMLTAVVTVIGVATLVHVMVRHRELILEGTDPETSLRISLTELLEPIWWACATDAVAFGALMTARVGPVRDFGLMMAVGSLMVFVGVLVWVPALALVRSDVDLSAPVRGARFGAAMLASLARWVLDHPMLVTSVVAAVTIVCGWGWKYLQVESDFTKNFRSDSPLVQAYERVESRLGGAGVADVVIPVPGELNGEFLLGVERMQAQMRKELIDGPSDQVTSDTRPPHGLTKVLSLADSLRELSPVAWDQVPIASLREQALRGAMAAMEGAQPVFYRSLVGRDPATGQWAYRVMLRATERQSAGEKHELLTGLRRVAGEHFPGAQVTGPFVLVAGLIDSVLADQWLTFTVALVLIGLMMAFAFRQWRWGLLLLIPNMVPIVIVMGSLGWLCLHPTWGWRVNLGVAMIAAVSTGLAIDGSLHYLFAVRRYVREGATLRGAMEHAHAQVGLSMALSTLSLVIGFTVLCASHFLPTVSFGAMTALTMLGGTVGNLLLLPVLVQWFERPIRPRTDGP
ncbi:MAG: MMPL family transporter [Pirellulales bacterium]